MMTAIIGALSTLSRIMPSFRDSGVCATGRYYATESMLVWDAEKERYDADATPEYGSDTLGAFYQVLPVARRRSI